MKRLLSLVFVLMCTASLFALTGCKDKKNKNSSAKQEYSDINSSDDSISESSSVSDDSLCTTCTDSIVADNSSITDNSATKPQTPAKTPAKPQTTVKPSAPSTQPAQQTCTVNAGCYQYELMNVAGWNNKYRPQGQWAYYTYGTQNAEQYCEVVKFAWETAQNRGALEQAKQKKLADAANYVANGVPSGRIFGRNDEKLDIHDDEFLSVACMCYGIPKDLGIVVKARTNEYGCNNAYVVTHFHQSNCGHFKNLAIAVGHQLGYNMTLCVGGNHAWIRFIKSDGSVWYVDGGIETREEGIADDYNAVTEDYRGI